MNGKHTHVKPLRWIDQVIFGMTTTPAAQLPARKRNPGSLQLRY